MFQVLFMLEVVGNIYLCSHITTFAGDDILFAIECCHKLAFDDTSSGAEVL